MTVDEPDNSDVVNPTAATLNVPSDGTLNRTYYLHKRLLASLACSWLPRVSTGVAMDNAAYCPKGIWYIVGGGNPDEVSYSRDFGASWTNTTVTLDMLACYGIDVDPAGYVVIANDGSTTIYQTNSLVGPTWAHVTGALLGTVHLPLVRNEPVNGVWLTFYCDTTHGLRCASSTDRTTWPDHSVMLPVAFATPGTYKPHMGVGGQNFVCAYWDGTHVQTAQNNALTLGTSSFAGMGWAPTYVTTVTDVTNPVYSDEDGVWLLGVYGTAPGTGATEFWRSTDGGKTWSNVSSLVSSGLQVVQLANIGHLWVGLTKDGFTVYSLDMGTSWYPAGMNVATPGATNLSLWAGGGGLLELDYGVGSNSRASAIRLGNQGAVALT